MAEQERLRRDALRLTNEKRFCPLAGRQWGTVREDYSPDGSAWSYFPFEHASSRAYRWGEDGILGLTDREGRICFAPAFWNGRDRILKERYFVLANQQAVHGEDCKDLYYFLRSTPTNSYMHGLFKYPQEAFPYEDLLAQNCARGLHEEEYELSDTGVLQRGGYWDCHVEYAKHAPNHILIRLRVVNRGTGRSQLHVLPTLFFRNTWTWACTHEGCSATRPRIRQESPESLCWSAKHETLGLFEFHFEEESALPPGTTRRVSLFTENETNNRKLFGSENPIDFVKDAFQEYLINGSLDAVNPKHVGSKACLVCVVDLGPGEESSICLQLLAPSESALVPFGAPFDAAFSLRRDECEEFYNSHPCCLVPRTAPPHLQELCKQAFAGLFWSKIFYHYVVADWLHGDPLYPPPASRLTGRNCSWREFYARDVLSVPDSTEYPYVCIWDLAFHCIAYAPADPHFAQHQLSVMLREWYMSFCGQLPAYEWNFSDVNPPNHAFACWEVFRQTQDRDFLESVFQKLLLNFTWWTNVKDPQGKGVFSGGFLGLDNISLFDRSSFPLPGRMQLWQADGTSWMGIFSLNMLSIALELSLEGDRLRLAHEDMASRFFEYFVQICDAMNFRGGFSENGSGNGGCSSCGLWDPSDMFFYDHMQLPGHPWEALRIRSLVGLIPLWAVEVLRVEDLDKRPGFRKRFLWFLQHRKSLAENNIVFSPDRSKILLSLMANEQRLRSVLRYLLDEKEFLSKFGIRSLSRYHEEHPYEREIAGQRYCIRYVPGESDSRIYGGNSSWRGAVWTAPTFMVVRSLEKYHEFFGDGFVVECPTGSGQWMNLQQVAVEICQRHVRLFGERAWVNPTEAFLYEGDPSSFDSNLNLFYEYFHAETGRGLGASHQTGWTALIASMVRKVYPS